MIYTTKKIDKLIEDYQQGKKIPKIFYDNQLGFRKVGIYVYLTPHEMEEYVKCATDLKYFAQKCKVPTVDGFRNIELRKYQIEMLENYQKNRFTLFCASRQIGSTIIHSIIILHELIFGQEKSILFLDNKLCSGVEVVDKIKDMYAHLPFYLKPGVVAKNRTTFKLENMNCLYVGSGSKSSIGRNWDRVFLHNFAFMRDQENLLRTLLPCTLALRDTKMMISSSPNGNNLFYELLINSERKQQDPKKNNFVSMKVYWWEVPGRDELWKTKEIKNLGSEDLFNQEYDLKF